MSDPNGLVYYNGKYHMFYQYNPSGILPANQSWGHAVSTDLLNWEEKPVAIPVQNGVKAFSGSVVVDWKNTSGFGKNGKPPLVAIYTGKSAYEDQRIAYSNDEGTTWTNYSQNPVLTMNNNQFRDPKVIWDESSQKWIMVVSQGSYQGIRFYSSADLKNWINVPGFPPYGNLSGFWECPDLFPLAVDNDSSKVKWMLAHSVSPTGQYFLGEFNNGNFNWEKKIPNGILIDGFETETFQNWTVSGSSFGSSPLRGTGRYSGYMDSKLVTTVINGNVPQGKMISHDFIISKKHISFLIGGGYHPGRAYIKLVVNGEVVRTSTGMNEDIMKWRSWDVSSLAGKTARIEIVDSSSSAWGHINIDHIMQSDVAVDNLNTGQIDYGKDFYAVQSFSDAPNGRRIWLGWMNNWIYAAGVPTTPWKGIMSIPREVKLETHDGQVKLVQTPIEELKQLRKNGLNFDNALLSQVNDHFNSNMINDLQKVSAFKRFELKAKVSVSNKSGFSLKFKKKGASYSEFIFDFVNKEIRFDRSRSTGLADDPNFKQLQIAPLIIENGFFDIHLFVDNCSAELFASNGQVVMSNQVFHDSTSHNIELTALGENFRFEEFSIWNFEKSALTPGPVTVKYPLFKVYPNPIVNSNGITIKIKDELAGQVKFNLFNADGMLIYQFQPSSNSLILPKNKLAVTKGLFFLSATDGSTTQTEKLLILAN